MCISLRLLVWIFIIVTCYLYSLFETKVVVEPSVSHQSSQVVIDPSVSHQSSKVVINQVKKILLPPPPLSESMKAPIRKKSTGEAPSFLRRTEFLKTFIAPQSGFFVEAGAHDGEFLPMTLSLEVKYNWTGLLVEPNPDKLKKLIDAKRNAWIFPCALSRTEYSENVTFHIDPQNTGASGLIKREEHRRSIEVQSFPLYSVLKAMNVTRVDFLGLDVEGVEMDIIHSVPPGEILFRAVTAEYLQIPGGLPTLKNFMQGANYTFITDLADGYASDALFVHNSEFRPEMLAT